VEVETHRIELTLSPQAERYARSDAPREVRLMAARGALPFPPIELATVLFALLHDPDPQVKDTARESLRGLPDGVMDSVLTGDAHPALLSHLAHELEADEARLQKIALNAAADDDTIAFLASLHHRTVVDIVSNNQERMLRAPQIVDALGSNPLTGRAVIERIFAFLGLDAAAEDAAPAPVSDAEAEAALRAILGEDLGIDAAELVVETDADAAHRDSVNLYQAIQKMTVFQKIKLARLGNQEARGLLIRERNKVVAIAAITNPKVTENEVVAVAQSRNVHDEVLRIVSRNREWTRSYPVKLALVTNPRCPPTEAMKFVNHLQEKDLRSIMRSRDVPRPIAAQARRLLAKKGRI
jgi:hypothetical protein